MRRLPLTQKYVRITESFGAIPTPKYPAESAEHTPTHNCAQGLPGWSAPGRGAPHCVHQISRLPPGTFRVNRHHSNGEERHYVNSLARAFRREFHRRTWPASRGDSPWHRDRAATRWRSSLGASGGLPPFRRRPRRGADEPTDTRPGTAGADSTVSVPRGGLFPLIPGVARVTANWDNRLFWWSGDFGPIRGVTTGAAVAGGRFLAVSFWRPCVGKALCGSDFRLRIRRLKGGSRRR